MLSVTDGCGGIPEEDLPRVFDTGWRGTHARTPPAGAGLGLAIVRGIVEAHQGRGDRTQRPGRLPLRGDVADRRGVRTRVVRRLRPCGPAARCVVAGRSPAVPPPSCIAAEPHIDTAPRPSQGAGNRHPASGPRAQQSPEPVSASRNTGLSPYVLSGSMPVIVTSLTYQM